MPSDLYPLLKIWADFCRNCGRGHLNEVAVNGDCDVGDRVIYHDPTPLHGVFHAVVTGRVTMPSGTVRVELDLEDPRPGDPPFRFATGREVHAASEMCSRCTTDISVAGARSVFS
jgi:hypothetical protein